MLVSCLLVIFFPFKPVKFQVKKDAHELICPVSIKAPISRKDDGAEPIMRSAALICSQTSTAKPTKNSVNTERKQSSDGNYGNGFGVPEWKHRNVLPLISESIKTQTTCRTTSKQQKTKVVSQERRSAAPRPLWASCC